jgi:hypothetical protein
MTGAGAQITESLPLPPWAGTAWPQTGSVISTLFPWCVVFVYDLGVGNCANYIEWGKWTRGKPAKTSSMVTTAAVLKKKQVLIFETELQTGVGTGPALVFSVRARQARRLQF